MGENHFAPVPTAVYGVALLDAGNRLLRSCSTRSSRQQGRHSVLAAALGKDLKGKISPALYIAGIALAFVSPLASSRSTFWLL